MAQQGDWGPTGYPQQGYGQQDPTGQYDPEAHRQRLDGPQLPQQAAWNQAGYGPQPPYPPPGQQYPPQQYPPQPGQYPPQPGQYPPQPGQWQPYPGQPQFAPGMPQFPMRQRHTVRNVFIGVGSLIAGIIVISVAALAAGSHGVKATGSSAGATASISTSAHGNKGAQKPAGIGSSITLPGNNSGEQVAVTVTKVIAGAHPTDEFDSAPAGDRLYAVQFRLQDTGSAAYSDAPSNGTEVVDSAGQSYDSSFENAADCASFPGTENIAAGSSGLGCVVFEVPEKAKIVQVQFTLDSGFGPQTGQWNVG